MNRACPERRAAALLLALCLGSCGGGGSPSGPGAAPTAQPFGAAGTTLTFVSGEDGAALAGGRVVVGGVAYTSDGSGRIVLTQQAPAGSPVDVTGTNVLDRRTILDASDESRFTLWPKTSRTGMNEEFTAQLVYTSANIEAPPRPGSSPLQRLLASASRVVIQVSPQILGDPRAAQAHVDAASKMTRATGSRVDYDVEPEGGGAPQDPTFLARIDPADDLCADVRAVTRMRVLQGEITGGTIVYCGLGIARSSTVLHELGHTFGLQHYPGDPTDIMCSCIGPRRRNSLSARDGLVMRLMLQRPAGNRYPDDDRSAQASARSGLLTIRCRGG